MYNPEKQARAAGGKFGGKVADGVEPKSRHWPPTLRRR
jgi:hypothetical protein